MARTAQRFPDPLPARGMAGGIIASIRNAKIAIVAFSLVWVLAGCASMQAGGDFQRGRQALLRNQPQQALPHFLEVAQQNPDYVYHSMNFREGIWTYVGRTQYELGRLKEARQSLQRALAHDPNDHMARLYLSLTLMRTGEHDRGLKELATAMRGLHEWIEYMERTQPMKAYWDPTRDIRGAIEEELEKIKRGNVDREQLIANAEWLGKQIEEEIDRARRDERRQWESESDRRHVERIRTPEKRR